MSIVHTKASTSNVPANVVVTRDDGTTQPVKRVWVDDQGVLIVEYDDGN